MIKIPYKIYNKRRWWDNNIGRFVKVRLDGKDFFTGKIMRLIDTHPLDRPYSNWWYNALIKNFDKVFWDVANQVRVYDVEKVGPDTIQVLKLLGRGEEIIYKLQLEIDKNDYPRNALER